MRRMEAIKRVEELTYQVEALTRENTDLRIQVCDTRELTDQLAEKLAEAREEYARLRSQLDKANEELRVKYIKIGNLIKDNGRLLNINSYLAEAAGQRKAVRKIDGQGNWIPQEERK